MNRKHMELIVWYALVAIAVAYIVANSVRPRLPDGITWADVKILTGAAGLTLWFAGVRLRRAN